MINIRYVPLSNTFNAMVKRTMDVVGSIMAIIVSSPVMLLMCPHQSNITGTAYLQTERVGLHNKTFRMYKFRSMEIQPEAEERKAWTVKNDRELPESVNLCEGRALMNFHSFLIF